MSIGAGEASSRRGRRRVCESFCGRPCYGSPRRSRNFSSRSRRSAVGAHTGRPHSDPAHSLLDWRLRNLAHLLAPIIVAAVCLIGFPFVTVPLAVIVLIAFLVRTPAPTRTDRPDRRGSLRRGLGRETAPRRGSRRHQSIYRDGFDQARLVSARARALSFSTASTGSARHIATRGGLGRIGTIHFAHWVFLDERRRGFFCSNYDGGHEAYMDDFINKAGFGLNLSFSSYIAYPRTDWLIAKGAWRGAGLQAVPATSPNSDRRMVQGLSRSHRARPRAQHPYSQRVREGDDERRRRSGAGWRKSDSMTRLDVDRTDIQAIARTAFGSLNGASLPPVASRRCARRAALARRRSPRRVADLSSTGCERRSPKRRKSRSPPRDLTALGVDERSFRFRAGVRRGHGRRARTARNASATSAPTRRRSGQWGVGDREPHILLMLFAGPERIAAFEPRRGPPSAAVSRSSTIAANVRHGRCRAVRFRRRRFTAELRLGSVRTPGTKADRASPISSRSASCCSATTMNTAFRRSRRARGQRERTPGCCCRPPARRGAAISDRNGSYLVFRQLSQDVLGFWRWVAKEAAPVGADAQSLAQVDGRPAPEREPLPISRPACPAGGRSDPIAASTASCSTPTRTASRARSAPTSGGPIRAPATRPRARRPDRQSARALGLTTRRQRKPTSSTLPWEKNTTVWPYLRHEDDAIASARFHRILRRGREYGTKVDPAAALDPSTPDPGAGLQFLCLNANIARQFEFVQGAWLANAKFAGLTGEQDPLVGNREPFPVPPVSAAPQRTDSFTRPGAEPDRRRATGVPQFVTVRGGAYFFLPGLAALKWIASL